MDGLILPVIHKKAPAVHMRVGVYDSLFLQFTGHVLIWVVSSTIARSAAHLVLLVLKIYWLRIPCVENGRGRPRPLSAELVLIRHGQRVTVGSQ